MNNVKTILSALLMLASSLYSVAQEAPTIYTKTLVVTTADGNQTKFALKEKPQLTIHSPYLVVKTNGIKTDFELEQMVSLKYIDVPVIPGDSYEDRHINTTDITTTVNYFMGKRVSEFNFSNADANDDEVLNVADIVKTANIIHAEGSSANSQGGSQSRSQNGIKRTPLNDSGQRQYALYNYRNDANFHAWLNIDIDSITYSKTDTLGIEHKDWVVQEVWTPDSTYRIPIQAIDSIGFRAPATEFKVGVFIIDEKQLPYITDADNLSISFMLSTPSDIMPVKGQVVYSDLVEDPFFMGFAGRVIEIEHTDVIKYKCEPVSPGEVYEKCVEIIKISSDEDEVFQVDGSSRSRTQKVIRRNIADDGIIKIPSLQASASIKGVGVSARFTYTIDYAFSVGITDRDFASLKVTRESEYSADLDIKLEKAEGYSEETWLPWPIYTLGAGNKLGFSVNAGLFFDLKGSTNLTAKIPFKSTHVDFYTWSSDTGFQYLENKEGGWPGWNEFLTSGEVKLKVKGSVAFGPILEASFQIWKPSFLSIDARAKAGLELSGELSLDLKEIVTDGLDFYKTVSEDMKITTGLKIGGEIGYTIKDKFEKLLGADATFFKTERYFFPRFTEPKMPDYISGEWEGGCEPMSVFTQPSNLIFFPGKVGLGVYDVNNECLGFTHSDNFFFGGDKDDWEKNWLQCDISKYVKDKPSGSQLYIHPLFDMLGIMEFKGSPKAVITIPEPLSLGLNVLNIEKGKTKSVLITGGWGEYSAFVLDKAKFSADIRKSGDNTYVEIVGLSEGSTTVTIKDLRTGETKAILVKVTDEETASLQLSSHSLDLIAGKQGNVEITSGSGKYTVESSNTDVATVKINNGSFEVTAIKAGTTTITVTDTENNLTATIEVTVKEEEIPYIPDKTETFTVNGVSFNMVKVEGGTFMMGSETGDPDESPQHEVTLGNYYIGQTEVTQELWKAVMGSNSSKFTSSDQLPVDALSWDDCQQFVTTLNEKTGLQFRLPTEAEWEYASRGGNKTQGFIFSGSNAIDEVAWYSKNSGKQTHCVASKIPNELGLYDMSGNVWEWCQDWYNTYSPEMQTNPVGPSSGLDRVLRGGGYGSPESNCRSTNRDDDTASSWGYGMRLALSAGEEVINNPALGVKVEPAEIDFGQVVVGSSKSRKFTVINIGTDELTYSVSVPGDEFDIPESGQQFSLEPGGQKEFEVLFIPYKINPSARSTVRILSLSENGTQYVDLIGTAVGSLPDNSFETKTYTVGDVTFTMVAVEGGTFMMGSPDDDSEADSDEKPRHQVTLSSFAIGETEVTQALWQAVMGSNPSPFEDDSSCPVDMVSWEDCQTFISKLNDLTGQQFHLPTEAQWEYAARGGNKSLGYKYSGSNDIESVAWYADNSGRKTHPVKTKAPNELGIYDMSGNVWEWCSDWYGSYSSESQTNPTGASSGSGRVTRGGFSNSGTNSCRSTCRGSVGPSDRFTQYGLRLALSGDGNNSDQRNHEWVDLGLPSGTLWASCNVGASSPEEFGGYYSWGETVEKSDYSWDAYSLCTDGDSNTCVDIGDIAGTQYDVAHVRWGGSWTIPTLSQMDELIKNCSSEWTEQNGVKGRKYTGPSGKSIFLPATGYIGKSWSNSNSNDYSVSSAGTYGVYPTSTLRYNKSDLYVLFFGSSRSDLYNDYYNYACYRATGRCVRPVISKSQ